MLGTYGKKLKNIETEIGQQDYSTAILECGKLVEYIISDTFCKFHTVLATPKTDASSVNLSRGNGSNILTLFSDPPLVFLVAFIHP